MESKKSPMIKIAYEILALEVDRLYDRHFNEDDNRSIEEHCEYIAKFIEAGGWTVEDFMQEYVRRGLQDLLPQNKN